MATKKTFEVWERLKQLRGDLLYHHDNLQESFVVTIPHISYFKGDIATVVVLSYLIHICRIKCTYELSSMIKNDLWMRLPVKKMIRVCFMSSYKVRRAIKLLEEHGIIEIDNRLNNCQWIRFTESGLNHINVCY